MNPISTFYAISDKKVSKGTGYNNHKLKFRSVIALPEGGFTHPYPVPYIEDVNISGIMSPDINPPRRAYTVLTNNYKNMSPVVYPPMTSTQTSVRKVNTNRNKNSQTGVSAPYIPSANCFPTFGFVKPNQT